MVVYYVGDKITKILQRNYLAHAVGCDAYTINFCGYDFLFRPYTYGLKVEPSEVQNSCFISTSNSKLLNYIANESKFSICLNDEINKYFDENWGDTIKDDIEFAGQETLIVMLSMLTVRLHGDVNSDILPEVIKRLEQSFSYNKNETHYKKSESLKGSSAYEKLMNYFDEAL